MREIEFRIKDCKGKWHYGYPVFFDDGSFNFFVNEKLNDELLPYEECSVECAFNNTLGQYTGLCDKNGKKIYEGDVVKCDTYFDKPQLVKWDKEWCVFQPIFDASPIEVFPILSITNQIEVIGNVFDNPELLEE